MSKFKVGDKVIRVQDAGDWLSIGQVCTVTKVADTGRAIQVDVTGGWYNANNFEHYVEQPAVDSTAVLTPLKVFECILDGTPLEYRTFSSPHWHTLEYPEQTSAASFKIAEFRIESQTVEVNGIDVPKPVKLPTGTLVWYPAVGCNTVQRGRVSTSLRTYWTTEEDAQAVLDAILTSFSK